MVRRTTNALELRFPDLFFEVSCDLQILVERYEIDYNKSELCFMRRGVLRSLQNMGITQFNYSHYKHHFTKVGAEFIK